MPCYFWNKWTNENSWPKKQIDTTNIRTPVKKGKRSSQHQIVNQRDVSAEEDWWQWAMLCMQEVSAHYACQKFKAGVCWMGAEWWPMRGYVLDTLRVLQSSKSCQEGFEVLLFTNIVMCLVTVFINGVKHEFLWKTMWKIIYKVNLYAFIHYCYNFELFCIVKSDDIRSRTSIC